MTERTNPPQLVRIALAGLGAIGFRVAQALDAGIPGYALTAVAARDKAGAKERLAALRHPLPVVDIDALEPLADWVVECAPARRPDRRADGGPHRP